MKKELNNTCHANLKETTNKKKGLNADVYSVDKNY